MGFKFVLAVLSALLVHENICEAGKAFGGVGGFGGAGSFGGFGANIGLINQQRFKLITVQKTLTNAVDVANTTIQNNIATAQNSIDQEALAAQNKAQTASNQACAQQHSAALSLVNSESVKACDQADQFLAIDSKTTLLGACHSKIALCYSMCSVFSPPECVTNILTDVDAEVTNLNDSILEDVTNIKADADQCLKGQVTAAHNAVVAANNALDECVKSSVA